ncbi:dTDP-4-dehydrorhamnose 3,5-epimerase [Buttiauxella agrestis]|uniref:dTDP-4-dehydrorhamnose 3,5-epimerase n=1 Tax=Buttiauxella agrestis ATCC 33320 TaxID=1006004 RepID=A0A085GB61_9ENTR|nr:dTDP-4-dehydrorhamnose 3,5-epimerase [Buttiauxella agrestis]KFC80956.1 dTDP-4-dehydrorhamnose 3,5-epimerase [Buttiauxella agrestis ATCC 33320]
MKIIDTSIADLKIIEPKVFSDERGFFMESFNLSTFNEIIGSEVNFVQDNHSRSTRGVLRGMHFQKPPFSQGKLVRCTLGEVFDVAVDIRIGSKTFGKWVGVILSAENKRQFWIPEGFAHGFVVISECAEFMYKTTNYYNPSAEAGFVWNDQSVNIDWPVDNEVLLSEKDKLLPTFGNLKAENI